jgi:hypothetical protein
MLTDHRLLRRTLMNRSMRCLALVSSFLLPAIALGAEDDSQAIIDKAIKAHGGADKLTKFQAARSKSKGTIDVAGGISFTSDSAYQHPNKFKESLELDVMGNKVSIATVFNGEKGWISVNGETKEMDEKVLDASKEQIHFMQVMRMAFLKDKKCEFSPLGEVKVNDKAAVGVKVTAKGHKDINLYFDKETGLLAKVERQALDAMTGMDVAEERIITEYQDIDGLKVAKKVLINHDGKKFLEVEIIEHKPQEKLDADEFGKP